MARKKVVADNRTKVLNVMTKEWQTCVELYKPAGLKDSSSAFRAAMKLLSEGLVEASNIPKNHNGVTGMVRFRLL